VIYLQKISSVRNDFGGCKEKGYRYFYHKPCFDLNKRDISGWAYRQMLYNGTFFPEKMAVQLHNPMVEHKAKARFVFTSQMTLSLNVAVLNDWKAV
jgi:hypothetical protein